MAKKRDLVVNDLSRYEKSSARLVLEDYSSCEVPAGCGGGILRWIDPREALPLTLHLWKAARLRRPRLVRARAPRAVRAQYIRFPWPSSNVMF